MAPLAPFNPPLGPNQMFCQPNEQTLQMKEKVFSLTGDDFTVTTVAGVQVCKCKGKVLSISGAKKFTDMQGNEIFTLKNKYFSLHKSFHAERPDGSDIFQVKGHFSVLSSRSTVHFKNQSDGNEIELEVTGDWFDRSASITFGGRPVAHISRSFFNVRQIFGDKQTYFVTVAPGVDLTLIAAICVCLDERENES
ncbi:hypothetical protein, variant [Exophiala xenobiotica]|uniref:Uncharacterized protein n=1 Tax=Exophiala xenobiotica TaxID=348802 RepID=A0A0D2CVR1_9EURO|nr:hypothetical protein, variant [Exophiala xenobiotica]XP_013314786.1 uncharacterized protein PV05_06575 [Exophiala xenobiotica]KIW54201.1 hypothetical protein PV05_06575 [Exophiala xenobiotica]KIW54202.1 hypothetical protein, variant [Exophiala xenobiotica]